MFVGLDKFNSTVNAWFKSVETATMEAAAGLASVALIKIVEESPQFTGDFVTGWEVSIDTATNIWRPAQLKTKEGMSLYGDEPYQKGDEPAMDYALSKASKGLSRASKRPLGTAIYLSNSAVHDQHYALKIENNEIDFRPENKDSDRVVGKAFDHLVHRFSHIGKSQLTILRSVGV